MFRKKEIDFTRPSYFPVRISLGACSSGALYSLPFGGKKVESRPGKGLLTPANQDEIDTRLLGRPDKDAA